MKYSVKMYGGGYGSIGARPNPLLGPESLYKPYSNKAGAFETVDINIAYRYKIVVENYFNSYSEPYRSKMSCEVIEIE